MNTEEKTISTKRTFSRADVAKQLGVSVVTIDRAIASKKISFYRFGTRVLFGEQHLEDYLKANECKAKTTVKRGLLALGE